MSCYSLGMDKMLSRWLDQSKSGNPKQRSAALRESCPCHVRRDIPELWDRILEMARDADHKVRSAVLHTLADGSPRKREVEVVDAVHGLMMDENPRLRRRARQLMAAYRRTGKINQL